MKLPIAQLGQPVLWQRAAAVPAEEIAGAEFQQFLQRPARNAAGAAGGRFGGSAGLFQPAGFSRRRVAAGPCRRGGRTRSPEIEVFINPRTIEVAAESDSAWEGCLSFPELLVLVSRPKAVRVAYLNAQGEEKVIHAAGFPARVLFHEYDHLEGILTLDRIASTRDIIKASEIGTLEEQDI